jgi:hypothetical protein
MSLTISHPRLSFFERLVEGIRQVLNVRRATVQVARVRQLMQMTTGLIEANKIANQRLEKQNIALMEENAELRQQLKTYSFVDPNAKCPFCGATEGQLETKQDIQSQQAYVVHTCLKCRGMWPEDTIYEDAGKLWKQAPESSMLPVTPGGVKRL